jgi:glycosyltransferase involved in cell wall biosynthesis
MITFNHESYIHEAIEGVLLQRCNFPIELIIGDDFSTDKTREICEDYQYRHSEIRLLPSTTNIGVIPNFIKTLNSCTGKYIALCEGDDYWTDPNKLSKQVEFLELNPNYSFAFHSVHIINELDHKLVKSFKINRKPASGIKDIVKGKFIPTASMMIRREFLKIPPWFDTIYNGDWCLQMLLADIGPAGYLPEVMGVYRLNSGGLSSKRKDVEVLYEKINLLNLVNRHLDFKYDKIIDSKINRIEKEIRNTKLFKDHPNLKYLIPSKYLRKSLRILRSIRTYNQNPKS